MHQLVRVDFSFCVCLLSPSRLKEEEEEEEEIQSKGSREKISLKKILSNELTSILTLGGKYLSNKEEEEHVLSEFLLISLSVFYFPLKRECMTG